MKSKIITSLLDVIRLILAFIFIFAGIEKIKSPHNFAISIDAYQIFSDWIINFIVILIPWLELFVGFGIIFGYKLKANLYLYIFMMISFTVLILIAMVKGLDIECGCFGEHSTKVGFQKLMENLFIILLVFVLLKFKNSYREK